MDQSKREQPLRSLRIDTILLVLFVLPVAQSMGQGERPVGSDRDLVIGFERASELLESGDTRTGVSVLHQLLLKLGLTDDVLIPTDDETLRSLKSECIGLMRSMSDEDLEFYESQFGPEANEKLREAREANDRELLELVSRRYFFTKAGTMATRELGLRQMDSGDALAAALTLNRLATQARKPEQFEPALSVALATAWSRVGLTESADRALDRLRKGGATSVKTMAGDLSLTDTGWLANSSNSATAGADWPLALGSMSGSRETEEVVPLWKPLWKFNTLSTLVLESERDNRLVRNGFDQTRRQITVARAMRKQNGASYVPAPVPLVVAGRIVLRSPLTMTALRTTDGDGLKAGEVEWETYKPDPAFMEAFRENNQALGATSGVFSLSTQYAYTDLTSGTTSSNGRYVFAVEESRSNPDSPTPALRGSLRIEPNYLRAYGIDSGSVAWQIGGERGIKVAGMRDAVFLGPPVPFGDDLLVIVASRDELRLLQIHVVNPDAARPDVRLVWSQKIGRLDAQRGLSETMRLSGLVPTYAAGVVVCPTGIGEIVALDPAARGLLWRAKYERGNRAFQYSLGFLDSTPRIVGDVVVFASRDSSGVTCFDLRTGSRRWVQQFPRGAYLIADDESVIAVGSNRIHCYSLASGKKIWDQYIREGGIVGRGLVHGNWISLPLTGGVVMTLDRRTGSVTSRTRSPQPLGNLVAANGIIISQTPTEVVAFAGLESFRTEIDSGLKENPTNPELLATRATIRLQRGQLEAGLQDLAKAARAEPGSRAAGLLAVTIDSLEGEDLKRNFDLIKDLPGSTAQAEPIVTLRGFSGPAIAVRRLFSDLHRSLDLRLVLADLETHDALDEKSAKSFVSRFIQFARRTSQGRLILKDGLMIAEPRYLSSRVRKAFSRRNDRDLLLAAVQSQLTGLLKAGEFHVVEQTAGWFTGDAADVLIEQYATALADSDKSRAITWLQTLRHTRDPERQLRVFRLLVSLLREHRPEIVADLIDEVRHGAQEHASWRRQLGTWKEQPETEALINRTSIWDGEPEIEARAFETVPQYNIYVRDYFTRGSWTWIRRGERLLGFDSQLRQRFARDLGVTKREEQIVFNGGGMYAQTATTLIAQHKPLEVVAYDLLGDKELLWTRQTSKLSTDRFKRGRIAMPAHVDAVIGNQVYLREPERLTVCDLHTGNIIWSRETDNMSRYLQIDSETIAVTTSPVYGGAIDFYSTFDGSWTGSSSSTEPTLKQRIVVTDRGRVDVRYTEPPGSGRDRGGLPLELVVRPIGSDRPLRRAEYPEDAVFSNAQDGYCAVWNPSGLVQVVQLETLRVVASVKADEPANAQRVRLDVLPNRFVIVPFLVPTPRFGRMLRPSIEGSIVGIDRVTGKKAWDTEVRSQQLLADDSNDGFLPNTRVNSRALLQPFPFYVLGEANSRLTQPFRILDCNTGKFIFESKESVVLEGGAYAWANKREIQLRVGESISLVLKYAVSR